MKKTILSLSLSISVAIGFISCGDDDKDPISCAEATASSTTLLTELQNVNPDDYASKCATYKQALVNQKASCGDSNGAIQTLIDELDCSSIPAN